MPRNISQMNECFAKSPWNWEKGGEGRREEEEEERKQRVGIKVCSIESVFHR